MGGGHAHAPKFITYLDENVLVMSDALIYHQKSTAPIYALAKMPAAQSGLKEYADTPVRLGIYPSITSSEKFGDFVKKLNDGTLYVPTDENEKRIFKAVVIIQNGLRSS